MEGTQKKVLRLHNHVCDTGALLFCHETHVLKRPARCPDSMLTSCSLGSCYGLTASIQARCNLPLIDVITTDPRRRFCRGQLGWQPGKCPSHPYVR